METGFAVIPQCARCGDDNLSDNVICDRCRADGAHTMFTKRHCQVCDRIFLTHYLDADPQRDVCDRIDCRTATADEREAA